MNFFILTTCLNNRASLEWREIERWLSERIIVNSTEKVRGSGPLKVVKPNSKICSRCDVNATVPWNFLNLCFVFSKVVNLTYVSVIREFYKLPIATWDRRRTRDAEPNDANEHSADCRHHWKASRGNQFVSNFPRFKNWNEFPRNLHLLY